MKKFMSINDTTDQAREAISKTPMGILTIMAVMLLLIGRRETFYHATKNLLDDAIKKLKLSNYDIEEMCSVESKIARKTKAGVVYESDVEAIRNSISHTYYEITRNKNGSLIVRIERHDEGYDFTKEFTDMQFIGFFNDYLKLETFQSFILNTCLIQGFILRHLMNWPKPK